MKTIFSNLFGVLRLRALSGRHLVIGIPYVWLLLVFLLPFLIVLKLSVTDMGDSIDPFGSIWSYTNGVANLKLRFASYFFIAEDNLYLFTYLNSLKFALITTLLCLFFGYPFAYFMARAKPSRRDTLMMLVMLPFWTSFLLRIYAWKGILANNGLLNHLLLSMGLIDNPIHMMNTSFSLALGMVYGYLPFMILPLYANLVKLDVRYLEAAADLGASPWQAFWRITVPLSKSGIIAGSMLVFIPCIGEYTIPELLGGPETLMIGRVLFDEFFSNNDWPMASAVTVVMILLILLPMGIFNKYQAKQEMSGL
ncbi:ABC transporter permease subunit [Undibacterium parvum]|uniref:ABC transporter permease subunit n=2 Tax=Undibacterium TaxID=401469 RepID=A0A6M4A377_9BURK|nr:ABC transporter permease subunit [Undibacterium parvum]AZP14061.1 ABC transporter permease subunit [Undibacterium parvum]QJQ05007.1 ABC transporter permease subunit [Undibacterium piscinae]